MDFQNTEILNLKIIALCMCYRVTNIIQYRMNHQDYA